MKTLGEILFRPRGAAQHLLARPMWLGPFLCVAVASAVIYGLGSEHQIREVLLHLPGSASPDQVREILRDDLWRDCLFLPYRLALGWGGFAGLLYLSGLAFRRERTAGYRHVLALEVHAEVILLIPSLLLLAGIPPPSLHLLFPGDGRGFLLDSLLRDSNCFTLWYILTLSVGMAVLFGLRFRLAILAVAVCWGISESLNTGVLNLLIRSFHFHL